MTDTETFYAELQIFAGVEVGEPMHGSDVVNAPMIRHWCEAMGDGLAIYTDPAAAAASAHGGIVAPPTMLQAWVMRGLKGRKGRPDTVYSDLLNKLDGAGFSSVVAVNCEQEYERYLRPGDALSMRTTIESVSEEKKTGLGVGHFVTSRQSYYDQDNELVGSMLFRILKFRPPAKSGRTAATGAAPGADAPVSPPVPCPRRPRPTPTDDGTFFFEAAKAHKLMVQRCSDCGYYQYPPHAACQQCHGFSVVPTEISGKGEIYSFVVTHYPQVPSFHYPLPVALIQLDEGPRMISNIVGTDPSDLAIGMGVMVTFVDCDEELTLPMFTVVNR